MQPPPPETAHRRASSTSSAAPRRSVGCMAGLLRLLSPYHRSHHRKRLTVKNATPASPAPPPSPPPKKKPVTAPSPSQAQPQQQPPTAVRRRRSCEAPRSPTIAPEHRRASCDDSPRPPPPAIVARLMGLEESAPPSPAAASQPPPTRPPRPPPETAAEKRRKLLGALEKCDEDLKTLRRIIAAVRAAEMRAVAASDVSVAGAGKGAKWMEDGTEPSPQQQPHKPRSEEQYPSPNSVLDAITSPRFPCRKRSSPCTNLDADCKPSYGNVALLPAVRSKIVKPSRTLVFSGDYCKIKAAASELDAVAVQHPVAAVEGIPARLPRWTPSGEAESCCRHRRRWPELEVAGRGLGRGRSRSRSRAMVESVGEVLGQGAGEERCEAGRVGASLERAILHDLVADVVAELVAHAHPDYSGCSTAAQHGYGAMCRKRLCF